MTIIFHTREDKGGAYTRSEIKEWEWITKRGGYKKGYGFFTVHWEVQHNSPSIARLHVESPKYDDDNNANGIKSKIISKLCGLADIQRVVESKGYIYKEGKKTNQEHIRRYKSTEAFKVIINASVVSDIRNNISIVNDLLYGMLSPIIEQHREELNRHFYTGIH